MKMLLCLLPVLFLASCAISEKETPPDTTGSTTSYILDDVRNQQKSKTNTIEKSNKEIMNKVGDIDNKADTILIAPENTDQVTKSAIGIKSDVSDIEKENVRLTEALAGLKDTSKNLEAASKQVKTLENKLQLLEDRDKQTRDEGLKYLYKFITLFFVVGFAMLIGGAFITFWVNKKLGGALLGIGLLTVGFASASQYYLQEIAQIGLVVLIVGFLVAMGVVAYLLLRGKHSEEAVEQTVELIEAMKDLLSDDEREQIFGKGGFASKLTSEHTKKIIARIKIKNGFVKLPEDITSPESSPS